jgi:hypothetical protein
LRPTSRKASKTATGTPAPALPELAFFLQTPPGLPPLRRSRSTAQQRTGPDDLKAVQARRHERSWEKKTDRTKERAGRQRQPGRPRGCQLHQGKRPTAKPVKQNRWEQHHGAASDMTPAEATCSPADAAAGCNAPPNVKFSEHLRVQPETSPQARKASADIFCREPAQQSHGKPVH